MNDAGHTPEGPPTRVGAGAARRVTFDADAIRRFATMCGDHNPLHHDERIAAAGPFGTLIASGPHVVALMMGLDATFLSARQEALGLGFEFRFVKAVPAGTTLTLEWTITAVEFKASLAGYIVSVEGRAYDDAGVAFVTATGRNLVRAGARNSDNRTAGSAGPLPEPDTGPGESDRDCRVA